MSKELKYRLQDLINIEQFQELQDRLNEIYAFPSAIIDNDGNILTATAWQDVCTRFHRKNRECEKECIKSDQYILGHLPEANPAVSYRCPHGLVDNAAPIIIDGVHYGNFFTGQFFLEPPDLAFFREQARRNGFEEEAYLEAVKRVPVWSQKQLESYLFFIKGLIEVISVSGLKRLKEVEARRQIEETEERASAILSQMLDGFWVTDRQEGRILDVNDAMCRLLGYTRDELMTMCVADVEAIDSAEVIAQRIEQVIRDGSAHFESRFRRKDGEVIDVEVSVTYLRSMDLLFGFHHDITGRLRAQESLRASEKRFKALVEHSGDGIALLGGNGTVLYEGPTVEKLTGYTAEERVGQNGFKTIYPEDLPFLREFLALVLKSPGKSESAQFRAVRKDGTVWWVEGTATNCLNDESVQAIVINYRDITRRKQAEEALKESEERFQLAMDVTQDGLWDWDILTNQVYYSPAYFQMLGYQPNQLPEYVSTWSDLIHPEDKARTLAVNMDCVENRCERFEVEFRMLAQDGTWKWILGKGKAVARDAQGRALRLIGTHTDITARKHAEEALRESEASFRGYFNMGTVGMCVTSPEKGWIEVNDCLCGMLGYSREELRQMTWVEVTHPDDLNADLELFNQVMAGERDTYQMEKRFIRKDGSVIHVLLYVTCQRDRNGTVRYMLASLVDITEYEKAKETLQENEEKLRAVFNAMEEGMALNELIFDEHGNAVDYRILEINKAYEKVAFLNREQAIGKKATDIYHMDSEQIKAFWKVHKHSEHAIKTDMYIPELQKWRHISTSKISENRFATLFFDNTEQKNSEIALRESEERFRTLFETMSQGVIYYDADGKIVSANPAAEHILGIPLRQMVGKSISDPRWQVVNEDGSYFPFEMRPPVVALRTGLPVHNKVMGVFNPLDANLIWINVNAVPQFLPGENKPYQVYVTMEDISARKRNEDIMRARLRLIELANTYTVKELLQATVDEAGALVFSPIGFYHFVDPDQTSLTLQAWSTRTRREFCTASGEDSHYPISEAGVWADGVREKRPIIHNDYASLKNKRGMPEGHATVVRELVVPVMRGDRMVAIMGVGNKKEDYTQTDLKTVSALADFSWDIIQQRKMNEELRASEEQYRRLVNVLPSGVVVHTQGHIELVNRAGSRMFAAADPEQLVGTSLMDRVHPDYRELVREHIRLSQELGKEAELIEEKLLRLDDTVFDAEVAAISVNYLGKPSTLAVFNEISERKKRERELHAIATLSAALRTAPTRAEMLPVVVDQIVGLFNLDAATIEIVEPQTGDVVIETACGVWESLSGTRQKQGTGINAIISQTLKPFHSHDMENDPSPFFNKWASKGIKGCAGVPLIAQRQMIGFIWIGKKLDMNENEVQLLVAVADIAANAIHRATLHEQTQKDAAELGRAYDVTLEGWAHTLELRDQETEGHTRRVVGKTLELARAMGVDKDDLENIRRGALLHDIGKLGIPDSVLLKPGMLNEREWETMRRHPEYALNLLRRIDYLRPALDIPYCHHEKWDGTGYPRGLRGEEIPLPARIFAVADVWDALTNDRPYRPAWTEENALKYVREQSGKHFDPDVVEVFMRIISKDEA